MGRYYFVGVTQGVTQGTVLCVDTIGQVLTETADGLTTTKNNTENRPLCYPWSILNTICFRGAILL